MFPQRSERGFITFSGLLLLLVLAGIGFLTYQLLPPYINNYELQDYMQNLARQATYNNQMNEQAVRDQVLREAKRLNIPLGQEQLAVQRTGVEVDISAQYTVPVNLLVRQLDLQFSATAGNRMITAP